MTILFDLIDEDGVTVNTITPDPDVTLLTVAGPTGPQGIPGPPGSVSVGDVDIDDVGGLQAALDGRAAVVHGHSVTDVTGLQTALDSKESTASRGAVDGYAPLDSSQLIPAIFLPSYVDDVLEGATLAAFPGTGVAGKIYVALDSNRTYRWTGSGYVEIVSSPGSTDAVAEGSANLYYTNVRTDARITAAIGVSVQPLDADLTALAALTDPAGKLAGITPGATANSTDAQLRDRATHTGTQTPSTTLAATGTPTSATVLYGDNRWAAPTVGGVGTYLDYTTQGTAPATPSTGTVRFFAGSAKGLDAVAWMNSLGVQFVVGRDLLFYARNTTGTTLTKGTAVYIASASGGVPQIARAQADATMTKLPAAGLVVADIANNSVGAVMMKGVLSGVNTGGMGDGSTVYVSAATAGLFTATAPSHPAVEQAVGVVEDANATTGTILVNCSPTNLHRIDGTNQASFAIGDATGTTKSLLVKNSSGTGTLSWAPTANRTLTLPDATTTLIGADTTNTLTLKRVTKRVLALSNPGATPTINTDLYDAVVITGQTADITSMTTNLSGTPTSEQPLTIAVTGTAARAITWGATFENGPATLPTTTVTTTRLDVGFFWNTATSRWRCMATGSG